MHSAILVFQREWGAAPSKVMIRPDLDRTAAQRQTAVTDYLKSKQLLLFVFARQSRRGQKMKHCLCSSLTRVVDLSR